MFKFRNMIFQFDWKLSPLRKRNRDVNANLATLTQIIYQLVFKYFSTWYFYAALN